MLNFCSGDGRFIPDLRIRDLRTLLPRSLDPDRRRSRLHPSSDLLRKAERKERDARSKRDQQIVGGPGSFHAQSQS